MSIKKNLKFLIRKIGFDVERYGISASSDFRLNHYLRLKKIDNVLDVGANIGQYAHKLRKIGYKGFIMSFEPLTEAFQILQKCSQKDRYWKVYNFGLGDIETSEKINISKNSFSSSILDMEQEHLNADLNSKYISSEEIIVKRADNLEGQNLESFKNIFLKIDTQGYEDRILNGIDKIQSKIKGIEVEMSFYPMYKNQMNFEDLLKKIKEMNYELWDLTRNFSDKNGKILQANGVFFKNE